MNTRGRKQREPTPEGKEVRDRLLREIRKFRDEHGYPPTLRELMVLAELSSTSIVSYHLRFMEGQGVIERTPGASRGIRVVKDDVLY